MGNFDTTIKITTENMDKQLIENVELNKFIQFKLNKSNITKEDLAKIDEIVLDSQNIVGNYNKVYFEEIELFPNLEKITIRNLGVTSENINKLSNISKIEFRNCEIEGITLLNNVQSLTIINSEIENIEEIGNLSNITELELVNIKVEKFEFLKSLKQLKQLKIKNVKGFSLEKIDFSLPIEYLSVEKINELNLTIISQYKNLKTLSVDREESENWKNELESLKDKKIEVLLNDMDVEGEDYDSCC